MSKKSTMAPFQSESPSSVFADYASYYDLLYKDKDYEGEANYISELIKRHCPEARSILELGSGTGIHASLLVEKGYRVHGIERSPEMLSRSRILAKERDTDDELLNFSLGDIRKLRLNERFDAVIALFHVISYQTTNTDVNAAFATARHHLNPGGVFIFDAWYGPAVLTERPEVRIKRMADDQTSITRLAEPVLHPNENLVYVNYHVFVRDRATDSVKELKETHVMRYFFKPEIEMMAHRSRFSVLHSEEWMTGNPIDQNTWGACFIIKVS